MEFNSSEMIKLKGETTVEWYQRTAPYRAEIHSAGVEALRLMVATGQGDCGGSDACRKIILSLYNGAANPVGLTEFSRLDERHYQAALAMMAKQRWAHHAEIHRWDESLRSVIVGWADEAYERRQGRVE